MKRTDRLNSLLKEVISEVMHKDLHHIEGVDCFLTVTRVEIAEDLSEAKVYVNIMQGDKEKVLNVLQGRLAGQIAKRASKKVVLRYFPRLHFVLDKGLDHQMNMADVLAQIEQERKNRLGDSDDV